ncbi:MAG: PIN domain-containing protein [Candidatus Aenigmatarchaeota archaeon]|jgi:rRNA-processing protein FCF1
MVKILLDTNFLLDIFRFKVDLFQIYEIFENAELYVSSETLRELKSISNRKTKEGRLALIALDFIEKGKIKIIQSLEKEVDKDLIALAKKENFIVATNDKNLRKKLKIENIKVICLRNKKRIEVVE